MQHKPKNKVTKTFKENPVKNKLWNNINGYWAISAKMNNLKKYFFKFFVCIYPSLIWNAKIGKAIRPI